MLGFQNLMSPIILKVIKLTSGQNYTEIAFSDLTKPAYTRSFIASLLQRFHTILLLISSECPSNSIIKMCLICIQICRLVFNEVFSQETNLSLIVQCYLLYIFQNVLIDTRIFYSVSFMQFLFEEEKNRLTNNFKNKKQADYGFSLKRHNILVSTKQHQDIKNTPTLKYRIRSFKTNFMLSSKTFYIYEKRPKTSSLASKGHKLSAGRLNLVQRCVFFSMQSTVFQLHQLTLRNHKISHKYSVFLVYFDKLQV